MENKYLKRIVKVAVLLLLLSGTTNTTYGQACTDPVFVDAGVDLHVCASGEVTLGGVIYGGTVIEGTWTTSGAGTFDDPRSLNPIYTPAPADYGQTITITLTSDDPGAPCSPASDFLLVEFDNLLLATVNTTDTTICAGSTAVITGYLDGASTSLTWAIESGAGTITSTPGPNGRVTVTYQSVAADGGSLVLLSVTPSGPATNLCPPQPVYVNISVDPVPVVNAGADFSICSGVVVPLAGTISNGANSGYWSGGIGTFSNANSLSTNYTPHPNEIGTAVALTLTSINGLNVCPAQTDEILVTVEDVLVNVGADINVCIDGGIIEVTPLIIGSAVTGTWTGGLGTFYPDRNSADITYIPDSSEAGTTVPLTFTLNTGPGCPSVSDALDIFIDRTPLVDAGPDQTACIDGGSVFLSGIVYEYAMTGHWEGGAGTITPIDNDPTVVEYTPDPSEAGQTIVMTFLSDNGPNLCLPGTDEMTITFEAGPVASVGPEQRICNEQTVTVSGSIAFGSTGEWSTSGDGTFDNATSLNAVYTPGPNDRVNGYVLLTLTPDVTNYCTPVAASTDVVINPAIVLSTTITDVLCNGGNTGAIDLTATGGSGPLTYAWDNSSTSQDISTLIAGTYSVVVTDSTGCAKSGSYTVTQPSAVVAVVSAVPTHVLCNGGNNGAIDLTVSGGSGSYNYSWSNSSTTEDISGLIAGTYTVNISDANGGIQSGCLATTSVTINQPTAVSLSSTKVDVVCNGASTGSIDLTVSGGTAPYTYSWSNNATTQDISSLAAGTYTVVVNDANGSTLGCTATTSVTIGQPTAVLLSSTKIDVVCNGASTGSIDLTVSGGTAPYTYSWSNGSTTEDISSLAAGTYTVVVNDANGSTFGCTATTSVTIGQPTAVSLSSTKVDVVCNGASTGSIDLTVTGGTAPYTYSWSNGATTQDISSLAAGTYTVVVNDANGSTFGCTATTSVTISEPAAPVALSSTKVDVICNGASTGSIDLTVSGGTATYTYIWSNGATTQDIRSLAAGTYTVVVNDANGSTFGCTATTSVTIAEPTAVSLSSTKVDVVCNGASTGSIDLTVSGGTAPYTYSWSNGASTEDISSLAAGTYTVVVNDANGSTFGCTATTSVTIGQPTAVSLSSTKVDVVCNGASTGSIDLTVSGGTSPYLSLIHI